MPAETIVIVAVAAIVGLLAGYLVRKMMAEARIGSAEREARRMVEEAGEKAEAKKRETLLEAKEDALKLRNDVEREIRDRRNEVQRLERRLVQKEESMDRKLDSMERKEEGIVRKEAEIEAIKSQLGQLSSQQRAELERISGLTSDDARQMILADVARETQIEAALLIREIEGKAREEGERKAREIISQAIQRCAADHVAEATVAVIPLPSDEMKGRIIGREGRNIRAFETQTGIDLIIDDTPEAVILSGFDPIRREVAKIALERLIVDGRIHPARIEEMVEKAQKEVENQIRDAAEQAVFQTNVHGLHPELQHLLGKLKYRTSYGQNVLKHSIEVAHLAGLMAAELGVDITLAKRAGLLHDVGKAVDHEMEGPHVTLGVELAKKYRENADIQHAIAAHHGDEDPHTLVAMLVQAADAISAARPGARRETLEAYIKRLNKLEGIANSFEGVEKSYAIQAGREIRIMVKPDRVDDLGAVKLVKEVAKRIEKELEYPGQVKVMIIRETRVVEYAK
ncbi:MAG TPA: ribonuclease Y [Spirochaetia bacterium]|nr:ribonuclease Y [Spirochaetia bacterium]